MSRINNSFSKSILIFFSLISIFIALKVSFGSDCNAPSPLRLNILLNNWQIGLISIVLPLIVLITYNKINVKDKFALFLFINYIIVWIILAFNTKYYEDWKMENYLTVPFLIIIYLGYRWFKFSNISYTLIFLFMLLHTFGSHYTYSEVPLGFWLMEFFNGVRNNYDRIVHFSFGLLLTYPIREISKRILNLKGIWALYIPLEFILSLSCIYEIIEWLIAIVFGGDLGIAYLGTQGDVWDAQKDMFLAGLGSLITITIVTLLLAYYNRIEFSNEIKTSLLIKDSERLGEIALKKIIKK